MGRLLDLIKRKGAKEPTLGFRASTSPRGLSLLLVAWAAEASGFEDAADALLLESIPPESPSGLPWGVMVEEGEMAGLSLLRDRGGSFVFLPPQAPAEFLGIKDLEYFVLAKADLDEGCARALGLLPVDGIVVFFPPPPFKIEDILLCGRLLTFVGKPALAVVSQDTSDQEVKLLAHLGFKGLVIKGEPAQLREWKSRLATLSPLRKEEVTLLQIESKEEELEFRSPYSRATSYIPVPAPVR